MQRPLEEGVCGGDFLKGTALYHALNASVDKLEASFDLRLTGKQSRNYVNPALLAYITRTCMVSNMMRKAAC
jgi:hypothetical protein